MVQISGEDSSEPRTVATLKRGDYFGENALLHEQPRNATITACTELVVLKLSRDRFQHFELDKKLKFPQRRAVVAGVQKERQVTAPSQKSKEELALITKALQSNENLRTMVGDKLDDTHARELAETAWKELVKEGTNLITEGDDEADYFYIVGDGKFEVVRGEAARQNADVLHANSNMTRQANVLTVGASFGELALMYYAPRAATVTALADSTVWVVDRSNFKRILMKMSTEKVDQYVGYLQNVEILNSLLAEERQEIANAMVETHLSRGEVILKQGDQGRTFYILYDGAVSIVKDGVETAKLAASESGGIAQHFGELALLNNEPRAATVTVASDTAKVLVLERDSFDLLLGPLEQIIKDRQGGDARVSLRGSRNEEWTKGGGQSQRKIVKSELEKVGLLGFGGFGTVELWQHPPSGETFALKGISKGWIVKTGTQESVMNEKNILFRLNSPFIIKLHATYNGDQAIYFLLEVALGGELCAVYRRKGLHGSHVHAKFYVAAVVFAFEHCHQRRIIYRDLKPENLILTQTGNIKLTDMGLAKHVIGKTYTTCGTPDYFAPEIIESVGHTVAVDWWEVGILIFELLTGKAPFEANNTMVMYSNIIKGIDKVVFPDVCKGEPETLIKALLRKEPSKRLPMCPGGTKNIKDAEWYKGFDWVAMEGMTLEPPFKPEVKSNKDIGNFCADEAEKPVFLHYTDDGTGWDKDFAS